MYNNNKKGGAALVAVLIMMILVAAGTALMIVTGNGRISEAENVPTLAPTSSSADDTSSSEDESKPDDEESKPDDVSKPDDPQDDVGENGLKVSKNFQEIDDKDIGLSTKYAILVDADNNEILAGVNYEKKRFPASMTKVMTIVVAAENIKDPEAKYKFSQKLLDDLAREEASMAGFEADEEVPFIDLMYGAILKSGADASMGLAELVAGSEEAFVELMNKKAEELGLETTHFVNPVGLHDKEHYSTCKDMATILCYALKNETCKKILTTETYTTSKTNKHPDGLTISSTVLESLNGYYVDLGLDNEPDGKLLGGKSGFTDEARNALETIYEYNGKTYVCVVTYCDGKPAAVNDNIAVYEHYLSK